MDEEREFELRKLEDHAIEYYKEKNNGYGCSRGECFP